jgi:hypothetical protein
MKKHKLKPIAFTAILVMSGASAQGKHPADIPCALF